MSSVVHQLLSQESGSRKPCAWTCLHDLGYGEILTIRQSDKYLGDKVALCVQLNTSKITCAAAVLQRTSIAFCGDILDRLERRDRFAP